MAAQAFVEMSTILIFNCNNINKLFISEHPWGMNF